MRKLVFICLTQLIPLSASAHSDLHFGTQMSPFDLNMAAASDEHGHSNVRDVLAELELAFSAGTTASVIQLALLPETGTLFLETRDKDEPVKAIPLQIVSSTPATDKPGLAELMDGLVVASSGTDAFLLAPAAWDSAALVRGLAEWGTVVLTSDGRLEITNSAFDPALHFSATFTFSGIRKTGNKGTLVLQPPRVRNSNSNEHFYTLLYTDGTEEILQPVVADPKLMKALAALQLEAEFNRNLGVVSINQLTYRPSYFVEALQAETLAYFLAHADGENDIAFRPADINEDGLMDYQVISSIGSQWLFGQP